MHMKKAGKARSCVGKVPHETQDVAQRHHEALIGRGASATTLAVYQCRFCDNWHVGHRPSYRGQATKGRRR